MEADDEHQNPNDLPAGTLHPIAHQKHTSMLERLSNNHQSRLHQRRSSSPSFESVQSFLTRFSDGRLSIDADLLRCRSFASSDPNAESEIKTQLHKVSSSISDLEKLVSEHSYFLPPYELRSSLKTIEELKAMLERANAEIAPRKKFAFKSRASAKKKKKKKEEEEPAALAKEVESSSLLEFRELGSGFRNKRGEVVVKRFGASEREGDFSIVDLDSCDVYLKGRWRALFVRRIENCRVFAGPVMGSVLVEEVKGCLFVLAAHQIRVHRAGECDFYVRVRSRPVVEDCSGVRFAPYRLFYQGIDEDLRDSGLEEETGNWGKVDDFRWLRAVQSPNWCLIPEEEFVDVRDVSELEEKSDDN